MPAPAPVSTSTVWPCATYSDDRAGGEPTRASPLLISFGTPTSMVQSSRANTHTQYIPFRAAFPCYFGRLQGHICTNIVHLCLLIGDFMQMDQFDRKIIAVLAEDGRLTDGGTRQPRRPVASACTRRVQNLEAAGVIAGYRAHRSTRMPSASASPPSSRSRSSGRTTTRSAPSRAALAACPNVLSCHLMSGSSDYLVQIVARDLPDFERLHANVLGHLPGVARIEFEIRAARRPSTGRWSPIGSMLRGWLVAHERYDVVIVGGAAHGASVAYHLAADPASTAACCLVEKDPTFARAATALSCGGIRQQFSTPVNIVLSLYGIDFLRRAGDLLAVDGERPDVGLVEGGYLFLATRGRRGDASPEPRAADRARRRHRPSRCGGARRPLPVARRPTASSPAASGRAARAGSTATRWRRRSAARRVRSASN